MTAGTIVFWRHGQTDYNLNQRLQGQVDIPLNATGRMQAERASEYVAQYRPSRIVASDLGRAMATARFVGERVGLPVDADERLRERAFGEWEGLLASEISATWPEEYRALAHRVSVGCCRGGEPRRGWGAGGRGGPRVRRRDGRR